jgi:chromosome segregation ATPase
MTEPTIVNTPSASKINDPPVQTRADEVSEEIADINRYIGDLKWEISKLEGEIEIQEGARDDLETELEELEPAVSVGRVEDDDEEKST